ncbi:hypothetical protein CPC08DRAFT_727137 [Agrocybe pediades]|nr:hypothetical protein CPC08DRAFT_727137 [Agrocybe pediades]
MGGAALISDSPDYALLWMVWATKGASISALLFQFLEFFNQFIEEVEYLWRQWPHPFDILPLRILSIFSTWSTNHPNSVNIILSELIHNAPSERLCMTAFVMKAATAQLTTTCVETILVPSIRPLPPWYSGNRNMLRAMWGHNDYHATSAAPRKQHLQTCKELTNHNIVFCDWLWLDRKRPSGWLRTPVISLMLRDSVSVFILLVIITSTVVGFEVVRSIDDKVSLWAAAYSWYVALLSASGCRIILNMRMLGATHYRQQRHQQHLLTYPYPTTNEEDLSTSTIAQFSTIIDLSHDEDDASEDTNHSDYLDVRRRQLYYDS